jgi:hypothetical protein
MKPRGRSGSAATLALVAEDDREFYEERAAIMEHDGRVPRKVAERMAKERTKATQLLRRRLLVMSVERVR